MEENIRTVIRKISINNGFFPIDLANCYERNSDLIDNVISIFELRSEKDKKILDAACGIIEGYFHNCFSVENNMVGELKLLAVTAFMHNIQFFSMCWNYMIVKKHLPADVGINVVKLDWDSAKYLKIYDYQEYMAASGGGMRKFGKERTISTFGKIGQMCEIEDGEYQFYIELNKVAALEKFVMEIEFENAGAFFSVSIASNGDGTKKLYSQPVEVKDVFCGIRNLVIKVLPSNFTRL